MRPVVAASGCGEKDWRLAAFGAGFAKKKSSLIFHRKLAGQRFGFSAA
jgi:hypothetical protein